MRLAAALVVATLAGCAVRTPAPVVDRMPSQTAPPVATAPAAPEAPPVEKPLPTHTVKRGETLVGIALQYGLDYRELAAWNNIVNLNVISVGQVLVVAAPSSARPPQPSASVGSVATPLNMPGAPIEARPIANTELAKVEPRGQKIPYSDRALAQLNAEVPGAPPAPAVPPPSPAPGTPPAPGPVASAPPIAPPPAAPTTAPDKAGTDREDVDWVWPVKGKVLAPFSENSKGIDIGGKKGAPVVAAATGRVVYAGAGLRGYGKLIIIKHNDTWLSAYAHNENLLVKEQEDVRKGQRIAEMGATDSEQVKLHFEVRRVGKPVDPQKILPPM
jgi:lipoprotein NlpD